MNLFFGGIAYKIYGKHIDLFIIHYCSLSNKSLEHNRKKVRQLIHPFCNMHGIFLDKI